MATINYKKIGDYFVPDIEMQFKPDRPLGVFGRQRKVHLQENCPVHYSILVSTGKLTKHLYNTDAEANRRYYQIMKELEEKNPAPDKAKDNLAWTKHMTGLQETAREIVLNELILID